MSNLKYTNQEAVEELFELNIGLIMDFKNSSFKRFIKVVINIDIYQGKGYEDYCSKANRLRQIFQ